MAKSAYPRIQARTSEEMKQIFDEFLKEKDNMGQAEFFERYLPTLLMSIDQDLYIKLYKKVYGDERLVIMIKESKGELHK